MSDDLFSAQTKENIKDKGTWTRGFYLILFILFFEITKTLLFTVVIFQFIWNLLTKSSNTQVQKLSASLSKYIFEITKYLSYQTNEKPFPFKEWPS